MNSNITENVVIYDWRSFTTKQHTPEEVIEALGLSHCPWSEISGARGYMDRKYFGCISIHYNGREDMGVWCEMSGQGCRNFEDLTTLQNKWEGFFRFIHGNSLHITRLDVAYDDHTGVLDIDQIAEDVELQHFISCMRNWQVTRSSVGTNCQIGSPKSKVLVRIYDKAAECGFDDGRHWVRVELQLCDSHAEEFPKIPMEIGEVFAGVLLNYLRFVEPDPDDSNMSRWQTTDYWLALIGDVGCIKIFTVPGGAYNLEKCRHFVFDMAGNAIGAMLQIYESVEDFIYAVKSRRCQPNPKYDLIVKEHHARQEAFAEKVRQYFFVEDKLLSPGTTPAMVPDNTLASGSRENNAFLSGELDNTNGVSANADVDTLTQIAEHVSDIAIDPPVFIVEDLRPADAPVEDLTGLKALVTSIFGEYTPVTTTSVVSQTVGNDTQQYLIETVALGAAGVDYEWVAGVLLFAIMLFCLMKLLGGVLK